MLTGSPTTAFPAPPLSMNRRKPEWEQFSSLTRVRDKVAGNCEIPPRAPLARKPIQKMVEPRVLLLLVFFPGNTAHWGFSSTTNQSSKPSNMSSADWELLLLGFQRAITPYLGPLVLGTLRLLRKIFGTTNRGFWCSGTPLAQPHNICSVFFFLFLHNEPKAHRQK